MPVPTEETKIIRYQGDDVWLDWENADCTRCIHGRTLFPSEPIRWCAHPDKMTYASHGRHVLSHASQFNSQGECKTYTETWRSRWGRRLRRWWPFSRGESVGVVAVSVLFCAAVYLGSGSR